MGLSATYFLRMFESCESSKFFLQPSLRKLLRVFFTDSFEHLNGGQLYAYECAGNLRCSDVNITDVKIVYLIEYSKILVLLYKNIFSETNVSLQESL